MKIGDKVKFFDETSEHHGEVGTVEYVLTDALGDDTYIVVLENGEKVKVRMNDIMMVDEMEGAKSANEPPEIPEGARVISEGEFLGTLARVTTPSELPAYNPDKPMRSVVGGMVGQAVGLMIADELFGDNDVIIMTEDEFSEALWHGCRPSRVCETSKGLVLFSQPYMISIVAFMAVKKMIEVFYPKDDHHAEAL